jgi:hypothetical protein
MTHEPALPPLPDPIRQVAYNESKGYAFSAYTADQMRAYARAALDTGRPQYDWSLLEATQESLREHMAEIQRLRAALAQPAVSGELSSVSPKAQTEFMQALHGGQGTLDAWLECNNEAEVRAHVLALVHQPAASGEPVAWTYTGIKADGSEHGPHLVWNPAYMDAMSASKGAKATPLYAAPQPAPARVPLTDAQLDTLANGCWSGPGFGARFDRMKFARAIEATHGITAKEAP